MTRAGTGLPRLIMPIDEAMHRQQIYEEEIFPPPSVATPATQWQCVLAKPPFCVLASLRTLKTAIPRCSRGLLSKPRRREGRLHGLPPNDPRL